MSSTVYWEPYQPEREKRRGGWKLPLKGILVRRCWDREADGTLTYTTPCVLTLKDDGDFVRGLVAAGVEHAEDLLRALEEHNAIEIVVAE